MSDGSPYLVFKDATGPGPGGMDWGRLHWIANRPNAGVDATVGYVEIAPHTANPVHRHNNCSEVLVMLEGSIDHIVGEESVQLGPGDALVVSPGLRHGAINLGDTTARMIVVYDTGERDFEAAD